MVSGKWVFLGVGLLFIAGVLGYGFGWWVGNGGLAGRQFDRELMDSGATIAELERSVKELRGAKEDADLKLGAVFGGIRSIDALFGTISKASRSAQDEIRKLIANQQRIKEIIRGILDLERSAGR